MTHALGKILAISAGVCLFSVCALAGGAPALVTNNPSPIASPTIPAGLLPVLEAGATASPCHVPWTLLAAVAATESTFDPTAVSGAGAQGLFQFEPATFAEYADPVPVGGAVPASPFDAVDAAYAAARYLCSLGVVENPTLALVAYNCGNTRPACQAASAGYAEQVLATAAGYSARATDGANGVQTAAVAYAESQIGTPYTFGGASPQSGFDCSGLVVWAYGLAGVVVPRTANDQWQDEPHIPVARLVPGDLVFFGVGGDAEHVGISIGNNAMVDAPRRGADVRIDTFTDVDGAVWGSQTLLGATSVSTTDPVAL